MADSAGVLGYERGGGVGKCWELSARMLLGPPRIFAPDGMEFRLGSHTAIRIAVFAIGAGLMAAAVALRIWIGGGSHLQWMFLAGLAMVPLAFVSLKPARQVAVPVGGGGGEVVVSRAAGFAGVWEVDVGVVRAFTVARLSAGPKSSAHLSVRDTEGREVLAVGLFWRADARNPRWRKYEAVVPGETPKIGAMYRHAGRAILEFDLETVPLIPSEAAVATLMIARRL